MLHPESRLYFCGEERVIPQRFGNDPQSPLVPTHKTEDWVEQAYPPVPEDKKLITGVEARRIRLGADCYVTHMIDFEKRKSLWSWSAEGANMQECDVEIATYGTSLIEEYRSLLERLELRTGIRPVVAVYLAGTHVEVIPHA